MKPAPIGLLVSLATCVIPLALARSPRGWNPDGRAWEQGERVAIAIELAERGQHTMADAVRSVDTTTEARLQLTAEEVREGRLSAAAVEVTGFRRRRGAAEPAPQPDVQARLSRSGEGRLEVQPQAQGQPALPAPVLGLLRELAVWLDGLDRALAPPTEGAVALAMRWRPDSADLARAFVPGGSDVVVTPAEERLELSLEEDEAHVRVAGEGPIPLATLPGARSARLEGAPESSLQLRAEWPPERSPARGGTIEATYRFKGRATNVLPDGKEAPITAELERRLKLSIAPVR